MSETGYSVAPFQAGPAFATTHWSVVLAGANSESPRGAMAMEQLCRIYWYPLYAYIRRRGQSAEEAKDLTQEFFARLIEKQWIADADKSKGKFRTFLLTALNHFLANEWRRARAARRGGGQMLISLDDTAAARYAQEPTSNLTPERVYERRWALSLFDHALNRLRSEYETSNKSAHYHHLKKFLSEAADSGDYARVADALEMSPGAVATAVHRLRQHYRALVREEVANTVGSQAEVEDEMRWLLAALEGAE